MTQSFMLDTHTLLRTLYSPEQLPAKVRSILEDEMSDLLTSHVSPW